MNTWKNNQHPTRMLFNALLIIVILAFSLSACTGKDPETAPPSTDIPTIATATTAAQPTETSAPPTEVATSPSTPEVSDLSDGQWILFTSVTDASRVIYAVDQETGAITQISPSTSMNWDADLSPDGSRIVFVSARDGNPEIYLMNLDGSQVTRLTNDPAPDYSPVWSPDGSMIAFVTDRNGNADIYAMSANGSSIVQVTTSTAHDWYPTWGPDSTEIAFVSESDGDAELYIFNTNGSIRQVTQNTFYDADPAWSPNGRFIVFSAAPDDTQADIYMIRPDGTDLQQLTTEPANDIQPNWSRDGNYILFTSNQDSSTTEIYLLDESGQTTRLTNNNVDDRFPAWGSLADQNISIPTPPGNASLSPTAAPLPASACNIDQVIQNLSEVMGYDFVFVYGGVVAPEVGPVLTLSFWFIDYSLNPQPGDDANTTLNNAGTALETAFKAVSFIEYADPCVDELFISINPIVVDQNYHGWISLNITPGVLPETVDLTDPAFKDIMDKHVTLGYVRRAAPASVGAPPSQFCEWFTVLDSLEMQFWPISNGNTGFYFVRDDNGSNVWAYLDNDNIISSPEYLETYTLMILDEIECLDPDNLILHIVDDGNILFAGRLPREGIENKDISQFIDFP